MVISQESAFAKHMKQAPLSGIYLLYGEEPYLVQSYAKDGLYSWAAQQGIPAILVERGNGGTWSRAEVEACKENILQLLNFLGIRPYGHQRKVPREVEDARYETAQAQGYWYAEKKPGETFSRGELLGRIESEGGGDALRQLAEFLHIALQGRHHSGFPLGGGI